jgi:putative transcriptional regulator
MPKFGWDKAEADGNFRRHNVTFEAATRVFEDPFYIDEIDDREDYGEERSNIIGMADGRLLVVTYTLRRGAPASSPPGWRSRMRVADTMKRNAKVKAIDWTKADRMTDEDIHNAALADPDAQPLTDAQLARMRQPVMVKRLRIELGLSQTEFAERFRIPVGTLRDWEQHRSEPNESMQAYLKIIAADAAFVERTLAAA